MKIEEAIPEIRKGRRWRPIGQENWRGPWKPEEDKVLFSSWRDLDAEFEIEPEPEFITIGHIKAWKRGRGYDLETSSNALFVSFDAIDALKAAADKARGIKDGPEYRDPRATEWYAAGVTDSRPTRLDWYKKGHQAGWIAYENALKEKV